MDRSLGRKIDKRSGPQFGPDIRGAKRRAPLKEVKRVRTALSLHGIMIIAKDASLLKMLILN
jgi:hypothetical protein